MTFFVSLFLVLIFAPSLSQAEYMKGREAFDKKDYQTAAREWSREDSKNSPNSLYELGLLHIMGRGVSKDKVKASELFHKAAELGLSKAQYALWTVEKNLAQTPEAEKKALNWLMKAAHLGYPNAQYSLGLVYGNGKFLRQDDTKAYEWLQKAMLNGVGKAEKDIRVIKARLAATDKKNAQ